MLRRLFRAARRLATGGARRVPGLGVAFAGVPAPAPAPFAGSGRRRRDRVWSRSR